MKKDRPVMSNNSKKILLNAKKKKVRSNRSARLFQRALNPDDKSSGESSAGVEDSMDEGVVVYANKDAVVAKRPELSDDVDERPR